eukprot:3174138-Prymnesium_polylepis.1
MPVVSRSRSRLSERSPRACAELAYEFTHAGRLAMHDPTWPEDRTNLRPRVCSRCPTYRPFPVTHSHSVVHNTVDPSLHSSPRISAVSLRR